MVLEHDRNNFFAVGFDALGVFADQPKQFSRSDLERAVTREFCAECGTHLVTKVPGLPAVVLVGAVAYLVALPAFFSVLMPLQAARPALA